MDQCAQLICILKTFYLENCCRSYQDKVRIWEPPTYSPASYFYNPVYETEKNDVDLGLTSKKILMRYSHTPFYYDI